MRLTDVSQNLRAALADRYAVQRELGRGANAVVYLARDLKHDRLVALKLLKPELALAVRAERFLREIQIAARLSHPYTLPLYDSGTAGESGQFLYYAMPYVEGESLRDYLKRAKQLSVDDALRITHDVAEALEHAHKQGVVHRDIKPENILLHEGHALVADFGIARALTIAGGNTITDGVAVGTPAYMSLEQASPGGDPDARSDIYSLGCVLFELLTGHPPFTGDTAQEVLRRHVLDPVPSVRAARPDVPPDLEAAIVRALAKAPAGRFGSVTAFAAALSARKPAPLPWRKIVGAVAVLSAVSLLIRLPRFHTARPNSLVVLPFAPLATDSAGIVYGDGMSEDLTIRLGKVPGLTVIGYRTASGYREKAGDPMQAGRAIGVSTVVTGTLRLFENNIRVSAQLIGTRDGQLLWGEQYSRAFHGPKDIFDITGDIAEHVQATLRLGSTISSAPAVAQASVPPTSDLTAYDLYLRGRQLWNRRDKESMLQSIAYFSAATRQDSNYALAYSGLADAFVLAGGFFYLPAEAAFANARSAAERAVELDSGLAEAHTSLARAIWQTDRDSAAAEREFLTAIRKNPNYPLAHSWYGRMLAQLGRLTDSEREGRLGVRLDSGDAAMQNNYGDALGLIGGAPLERLDSAEVARRRREGAAAYRHAIALAPDWLYPRQRLIEAVYVPNKRYREAIAEYRAMLPLQPDNFALLRDIGRMAILAGDTVQARGVRDTLVQLSLTKNVWISLAPVYAALGEKDNAFRAMRRACELGNPFIAIRTGAQWDPLRSDPRFDVFVRRVPNCHTRGSSPSR